MVISAGVDMIFRTFGFPSDDCRILALVLASPITQYCIPTWTTPCVNAHMASFTEHHSIDKIDEARVLVPKSRSGDIPVVSRYLTGQTLLWFEVSSCMIASQSHSQTPLAPLSAGDAAAGCLHCTTIDFPLLQFRLDPISDVLNTTTGPPMARKFFSSFFFFFVGFASTSRRFGYETGSKRKKMGRVYLNVSTEILVRCRGKIPMIWKSIG
ncbi:hypothetical protein GE21DRAFT_1052098 [Neurospora crassa]|nr:hypothetical protein GE21DRAFT_1052098 [Neurospora crassa]